MDGYVLYDKRNGAFKNFYNTEFSGTYTLPETMTEIPEYAFQDCALTGIKFNPEKIKSIGHYAFYNCKNLTDFPTNLTNDSLTIGYDAFYNCNLSEFRLRNTNAESISSWTFNDSTVIHVPYTCKEAYQNQFKY